MSSATEELRRLLDERGVEWTKPKSAVEFMQTTFLRNGWGIEVLERNIGLCVTATNVFDTPEQAIAATLGSGECEWELEHSGTLYDKWRCSECKFLFVEPRCDQGYTDLVPNFCPNCGKAVER